MIKKNIKICHITSVHKRYDNRIFARECSSLADLGYEVVLLVNDGIQNEYKNGVFIKSIQYRKFHNRLERMSLSSKIFYNDALSVNAEIYHLHDPELLPLAKRLHSAGKKVIFDSHEDVPEQILTKYYIPEYLRFYIAHLYSTYESKVLKILDGVIVVTPSQMPRIERFQKNVVMVTNFPNMNEKLQNSEKIPIIKKRQICFAGSIDNQWCHESIIEAILGIENLYYCIAGDNTQNKKYWHHLISNVHWKEKINYLGYLNKTQLSELYASSICGMALLSYNAPCGKDGTLGNTKLFEYMENGLPVICSNMKLWKIIIDKYDCGIFVDPNNEIEIREALLYLTNNPTKAAEMGNNGRKAIQSEYNWQSQIPNLTNLYDKILYV